MRKYKWKILIILIILAALCSYSHAPIGITEPEIDYMPSTVGRFTIYPSYYHDERRMQIMNEIETQIP